VRALEVMAEVSSCWPHVECAALLHLAQRPHALPRPTPTSDAEQRSTSRTCAWRSQGVPVREVLQGVIKPSIARSPAPRHRRSARSGRAWCPPKAPAPRITTTAGRARTRVSCDRDERSAYPRYHHTARSKPAKSGDERITMAHVRRRQGYARLVEGLLAPAFVLPASRRRDGKASRSHHGRIRGEAAALPRRLDRGPGRQTAPSHDLASPRAPASR